jgi:hypothetical protein
MRPPNEFVEAQTPANSAQTSCLERVSHAVGARLKTLAPTRVINQLDCAAGPAILSMRNCHRFGHPPQGLGMRGSSRKIIMKFRRRAFFKGGVL